MDNSHKPKVLIVHNYYQMPGGEDTVVANERKLLEEHGHEVVLYHRNNSELKTFSRLQKILLPITTIFSIKTYREVSNIIREQKIDILHVHNTLSLVSPSVYYAAFKCKIPVVQTVHNFRLLCPSGTFYRDGRICEDCVSGGLRCSIKHKCYRGSTIQTAASASILAIHRILGTYDKINYICLTDFTKQKLKSLVDEEKIFIKPNFTFDEGGKSEPLDYYIFIGRLEEIKGIELLVDAFKGLPNQMLVVVGTGDLDKKIKNRLITEDIRNIKLIGHTPRVKVNELLKQAKALIMCSQWYETFGMVITEAYSNGTPAIVGDIGNIKDLVLEGETGLKFQYDSSEALREAILEFEKLNGKNMGMNAYNFFTNNYSSEGNYMMLSEIYKNVSNKK